MTTDRLVVVAIATAQPGKEQELADRFAEVARQSWAEPGIVSYAVHDVVGGPGHYMLVEVYENRAAFDAHLETDHVKAILADLPSLIEGELVVHQGNAAAFSEGEKGRL